MFKISDDGIHNGHRERMRNKLALHSARAFDTYELLEMLLYHVIAGKDTNPIAKRLLITFGGAEGVFSAGREELLKVQGIGERAADLILSVGRLISDENFALRRHCRECFDDYFALGRYIADFFGSASENEVALFLFDGRMNLLAAKRICSADYASAAVKPSSFITYAIENRAAVAVSAHTHPYGPLFPTAGDLVTNNLITESLSGASVAHIEHYVISGGAFVGIMNHLDSAFRQSQEVKRFIRSKGSGEKL